MKGIILAGGSGTRLYPLTLGVSKQLLPIYDQPLIHHSLSTLLLAGVEEILIIVNPDQKDSFERLLGDGRHLGISISYALQDRPRGIADALILGQKFISGSEVALILGDNIFYGSGLSAILRQGLGSSGAKIFACPSSTPEKYGVLSFDKQNQPISIDEKPLRPASNFVVPGLYFYNSEAVEVAKGLVPSSRGELEISDVNLHYLRAGNLTVEFLPRGTAWMDAGDFDALAEASEYVRALQKRQNIKIACPEEIAWRQGRIGDEQLESLARKHGKSDYGSYLGSLLGVQN